MPSGQDFIPGKDNDFFNFQNTLVEQVAINYVAWGITALIKGDLDDAQAEYVPLYQATINKEDRTSTQVLAHQIGRKTYEKYLRDFINERLRFNSAITVEQRNLMGIPPRDTTTTPRAAITVVPNVTVNSKAGSIMEIECRVQSDSTRTSKLKEADDLEVRYLVGTVAPAGAGECPQSFVSKKSRFNIALNQTDAGKKFYAFARWHNGSTENKSGPWSEMKTKVVLG